jgi:hypothetical protein
VITHAFRAEEKRERVFFPKVAAVKGEKNLSAISVSTKREKSIARG